MIIRNNYFPSLCVCPDITTATGELHVFDFDLEKEDRCSVADKLWDSLCDTLNKPVGSFAHAQIISVCSYIYTQFSRRAAIHVLLMESN